MVETEQKKNDTLVFVSYSHKDKPVAEEIATMISAEGISVWFDEWKVVPGDSIIDKIGEGLICTHFVFLISNNTPQSKWQNQEFKSTFTRYVEESKPKIIPILLDEAKSPSLINHFNHIRYQGGTNSDWMNIVLSSSRNAFGICPLT